MSNQNGNGHAGDADEDTIPPTTRSNRGGETVPPHDDWRLVEVTADVRWVQVLHRGLLEIDGLVGNMAREQSRGTKDVLKAQSELESVVTRQSRRLNEIQIDSRDTRKCVDAIQKSISLLVTSQGELLREVSILTKRDVDRAKDVAEVKGTTDGFARAAFESMDENNEVLRQAAMAAFKNASEDDTQTKRHKRDIQLRIVVAVLALVTALGTGFVGWLFGHLSGEAQNSHEVK